ncbi:hypothetical protein B6V01_004360 [Methanosarcinales archaeon ex4572_44]|nr:MAG: hypothetical protein B6U67_03525 [Methanosarcinales archaeon ex4484_138]PHP45366.1 MAG: hypothetical protein B6V01_004360 [Methanosarcinales archaeon ex4572_44]RLG27416.1 MAG: hypothetical protein DRN70_02195 [Methanosarcinales archaeon]
MKFELERLKRGTNGKVVRVMIVLQLMLALAIMLPTAAMAEGDSQCYSCHSDAVTEIRESVHHANGVDCMDCHGGVVLPNVSLITRDVMSGNFVGAPTRTETLEFCSKCHEDVGDDYEASVHRVTSEKHDAPECRDCHGGGHDILSVSDPASPTYRPNQLEMCVDCHDDHDMMEKYDVNTHVLATYEASYHWKAFKFGQLKAATCLDCHGTHAVKSEDDETSSTSDFNLGGTCGKEGCHPGVNPGARVWMGMTHYDQHEQTPDLVFDKSGLDTKERAYYLGPINLAFYIEIFFILLTCTVVIVLIIFVLLDLLTRIKMKKHF